MTTENTAISHGKTLLLFALIYNLIVAVLLLGSNFHQQYFYSYIAGFFVLWIAGAIALGILFWLKKMRLKTNADKVLLLFATPVPVLLLLAFYIKFLK